MKLRQPTRCPKIKMVTIESRLNSTSGKIHVGRCAMDSKVGLGLKIAPKIRPTELTDGADSGDGVTGLAMFFSSDGQRVEALVPSSSTLGRCEKLQAGRVYRNSGKLGNVDSFKSRVRPASKLANKNSRHIMRESVARQRLRILCTNASERRAPGRQPRFRRSVRSASPLPVWRVARPREDCAR